MHLKKWHFRKENVRNSDFECYISKAHFISGQVCSHQGKGPHFTGKPHKPSQCVWQRKRKRPIFQVQNIIQKQGHVSSSFVGVRLHPVPTMLYISDFKIIPHLILLNRKDKPHKTGATQQCSLPIVIWFTNSKLFSPIIVLSFATFQLQKALQFSKLLAAFIAKDKYPSLLIFIVASVLSFSCSRLYYND